jgi:hypothetical protein
MIGPCFSNIPVPITPTAHPKTAATTKTRSKTTVSVKTRLPNSRDACQKHCVVVDLDTINCLG